jgi:hypothetical protein
MGLLAPALMHGQQLGFGDGHEQHKAEFGKQGLSEKKLETGKEKHLERTFKLRAI